MNYVIIGIIVIALVLAGFWAGTKKGGNATPTPTPSSSTSSSPTPVPSTSNKPTPTPTYTTQPNGIIGNRPGNIAPDFRLKDINGHYVSLRDYLGHVAVKLIFTERGKVVLQPAVVPQGITLLDTKDTAYHLYGMSSLPYTVNIDEHGIIR